MAYFYGSLFLRNPELRSMFPLAMDGQRRRLFEGLARCAWGADQRQALTDYLRDLARDHRKFGVTGKHYRAFCDALLASLQSVATAWTPATETAWRALLDHMATVMAEAAQAAADEPAWWLGEITQHDRRGPGIAVLTIRPEGEAPLRYRAGQYISIQLPQWPRVWRCYSIANAPRPDGSLDLHVRAVPQGRVSTLLVEQARPGDSVVIGPPRGSMTLAAAGPGSILCVAGGTGLAPIKALAEELAGPSAPAPAPPIQLIMGARHEEDLYDLPALRRLADACPSLTVIPVISPPGPAGRAALPAAAATHFTPEVADVFVSGPEGMVRATIRQLAAMGPAARIHADMPAPRRPERRSRCASEGEKAPAAGPLADGGGPATARVAALPGGPAPDAGYGGAGAAAGCPFRAS